MRTVPAAATLVAALAAIVTACSSSSAGSDPATASAECGDGTLGGAEQCDDGNVEDGDGCTPSCQIAAGFCCVEGGCVSEGAIHDSNACLVCDPAASNTSWTAATSDVACHDGLFCNGADHCSGGTCSLHAGTPCGGAGCVEATDQCVSQCTGPEQCSDGNACTTDACVDGTCQHALHAGACDDGIACNGTDSCSGGTCSVHFGDTCELGCNVDQTGCLECADASHCDDADDCTTDSCVAGRCRNTPLRIAACQQP